MAKRSCLPSFLSSFVCLRLDMVGVIHCRLQGLPHSTLTEARLTRRGPLSLAAARLLLAVFAGPRPAITHGPSHSGSPGPESLAAASDCSLFQPRPESLAGLPSFRLAAAPVTPRSPPSLAHSVSAAARRHLPRPGAGVTRRGPSHSPRSAITHRGSLHSRRP